MGNILILAALLITQPIGVIKASTLYNNLTFDQALDQLVESIAIEYEEQLLNGNLEDDRDTSEILIDILTKREEALEKKIKKNERDLKLHKFKQKFLFTQKAKHKNFNQLELLQNERVSYEVELMVTIVYKEAVLDNEVNSPIIESPKELMEPEKSNDNKLKPKIGKRYLTKKPPASGASTYDSINSSQSIHTFHLCAYTRCSFRWIRHL